MATTPTEQVPGTAATSHSGYDGQESYARYARVRASAAHRPNYIAENAAPAMACLLRNAESRPYTPLPRDVIAEHVRPLDYLARPSWFVAQQSLMDFYRTVYGHYNVTTHVSEIDSLLLLKGGGSPSPSTATTTLSTSAMGTGHRKGGQKRGREADGGRHAEIPSASQHPGVPAVVSAEEFAKQADAYRLGQFRRQAQHVDTRSHRDRERVCFEFSARGTCAHGASCAFRHVGKNGVVIATAGAPTPSGSARAGGSKDTVVLPPRPQ